MQKTKLIIALILVIFGILGRIFFNEFIRIPNLEIITSFSLIAGTMLGGFYAFLIPLAIMAVSDVYFGNSSILSFTWPAFMIIGGLGWILREGRSFKPRFVAKMTAMGIGATLFFYLYTNFGWWLMTNMYPPTLEGLIRCYVAGLPFFKNQLLGNLSLVPLFTVLALMIHRCLLFCRFKFLKKLGIISARL